MPTKDAPSGNGSRSRARFDSFELNLDTGELLKGAVRVPLQDQPARLLTLLIRHSGELVLRTSIQELLWKDGEFVEFDHAINVAVKKIRLALGDAVESPRFIETIPKKGYRFIGRVEFVAFGPAELGDAGGGVIAESKTLPPENREDFVLPLNLRRTRLLFLAAQLPYVVTYLAVFYQWDNLEPASARTFQWIAPESAAMTIRFLALLGFAVRIYLGGLIGWAHPDSKKLYLRLFPVLMVLDGLWATTPLLVEQTVGSIVSKTGFILMIWLIFGQRTLILRIGQGKTGRMSD